MASPSPPVGLSQVPQGPAQKGLCQDPVSPSFLLHVRKSGEGARFLVAFRLTSVCFQQFGCGPQLGYGSAHPGDHPCWGPCSVVLAQGAPAARVSSEGPLRGRCVIRGQNSEFVRSLQPKAFLLLNPRPAKAVCCTFLETGEVPGERWCRSAFPSHRHFYRSPRSRRRMSCCVHRAAGQLPVGQVLGRTMAGTVRTSALPRSPPWGGSRQGHCWHQPGMPRYGNLSGQL